MPAWILIPLLGIVATVQVAWLPLIPIFGFKIDLALIVVVTWGLVGPIGEAALWGFIVGLLLDLASGLPFGIHTLTLTVVGLLVGLGQTTFFRGNLIAPPAMMVAATIVYNIFVLAILSLFNWNINWTDYLFRVILPTSLLNTLVGPLAYFPLQWLQQKLYPGLEF
ncbi:MAG: rod shape-determining protein MreD [Chloroflexi bacterium]|nr:rod shape-determining protein MreD [Chloroflexota bacterium]